MTGPEHYAAGDVAMAETANAILKLAAGADGITLEDIAGLQLNVALAQAHYTAAGVAAQVMNIRRNGGFGPFTPEEVEAWRQALS